MLQQMKKQRPLISFPQVVLVPEISNLCLQLICVSETELQHIQLNLAALALDVVVLSYSPTQTLITDDMATTNLERAVDKNMSLIQKSTYLLSLYDSLQRQQGNVSACVCKTGANSHRLWQEASKHCKP